MLCSVRGISSILVFRGASVQDVASLAPAEDKSYLQVGSPTTIEFSRAIFAASPAAIRSYRKAFGGPAWPRPDHDGINDAFMNKASTVRYWIGGKWLELPGAD